LNCKGSKVNSIFWCSGRDPGVSRDAAARLCAATYRHVARADWQVHPDCPAVYSRPGDRKAGRSPLAFFPPLFFLEFVALMPDLKFGSTHSPSLLPPYLFFRQFIAGALPAESCAPDAGATAGRSAQGMRAGLHLLRAQHAHFMLFPVGHDEAGRLGHCHQRCINSMRERE
jgi:hypothetical protein